MSRGDVKHGVVKKLPYISFMRMGNREIFEIMSIRTTSIEECGGREFTIVWLMNPKIMETVRSTSYLRTCFH